MNHQGGDSLAWQTGRGLDLSRGLDCCPARLLAEGLPSRVLPAAASVPQSQNAD